MARPGARYRILDCDRVDGWLIPRRGMAGDSAGFLNVPRIKGIHTALKSGMLAAEAVFDVLITDAQTLESGKEADSYQERFERSWLYQELNEVRNVRPAFKWGMWPAMAYTALEQYVLKGRG